MVIDPIHHYRFSPGMDTVLKQRGFVRSGCCQRERIIGIAHEFPDSDRWLRLLAKATARKVLRKIATDNIVTVEGLITICSQPKLSDYLSELEELGVIVPEDNRVRLAKNVDNFGPTLEWYVASVLREDFDAATCWGVEVEDISGGGDFDVLGWLDSVSALTYVECKTASPSDIGETEIRHFFQRCQELAPEIAILLVDTDSELKPLLDMAHNILLPIERVASGTGDDWIPDKPFIRPLPDSVYSGIHFGRRRIFVTTSTPSITTQLRKCLRYYSTWVRHQSFWGEPPIDYIHGEVLVS